MKTLRAVPRVQRIDLDGLMESIRDPCVTARWIPTKMQVADMYTKGNFTAVQWDVLCGMAQISVRRSKKLVVVVNKKEEE